MYTILLHIHSRLCKPSLLMLPRDHFFRIFIYLNSRCKVLCGCRKKLPRTSMLLCFPYSFGIIDSSTFKCWKLSTAKAGARGHEGCSTFSLSLINRLNQTESACYFAVKMLPRDHVFKIWKWNACLDFYYSITACYI
jgi:hypothetical protein